MLIQNDWNKTTGTDTVYTKMKKRKHEENRACKKTDRKSLRWTVEQLSALSQIVEQNPNLSWKEKTHIFNEKFNTNRSKNSLENQNYVLNKSKKNIGQPTWPSSPLNVTTVHAQNKIVCEKMENIKYMHARKVPEYSPDIYKKFCMEYKYPVEIVDGTIDAPQELENAARNFMKFMTGENIEDKRGKYQKETTPGGDVVGETFIGQCKYHCDGVAGEHIRKFYGTVVDFNKKLYFFANSYKNVQPMYETNIKNIHLFDIFNDIIDNKLYWRFRPVNPEDIIK